VRNTPSEFKVSRSNKFPLTEHGERTSSQWLGHQSLTIQRTAIEANVDTGLLKLYFDSARRKGISARTMPSLSVKITGNVSKKLETTNRQFSTLAIFKGCMTQPGLGYPISISDLRNKPPLAGCYQRSRRMQVFQESVTMLPRDFDLLRRQLECAGQFPVGNF